MRNILITFATYQEAAVTLRITAATLLYNHTSLYTFDKGKILLTGMGIQKTERSLIEALEEIKRSDHILNFGIVGALRKDISVGTPLIISHCSYKETTLELQHEGEKTHLLTLDAPLHDPVERDRLSRFYDVVDMEGYAITAIANRHKIPCSLYKIVSDHCNQMTSNQIQSSLPQFSEALANLIQKYFIYTLPGEIAVQAKA